MHGSPLSPYDNRDLWKTYDYRKYDLLGEAVLSVKGARYYSDTGRTWSGKNSLRDMLPDDSGIQNCPCLNTTDDLIAYIKSGDQVPLYLTVHPERWALGNGEWIVWTLADCAMNAGKKILRVIRA